MTNAETIFSCLTSVMFELQRFYNLDCPDKALCSSVDAAVRCLHQSMLRACSLCVPSPINAKEIRDASSVGAYTHGLKRSEGVSNSTFEPEMGKENVK